MERINYKIIFSSLFFVLIVILLALLVFSFNSSNRNDISNISIEKMKEKTLEKENEFYKELDKYKLVLKALSHNEFLKEYINTNKNKKNLEHLFSTLHKTLPLVRQIKLIDMQGNEKVRVNKLMFGRLNEKEFYEEVPNSKLQNKSSRYYFEDFKKLEPYEIAFSKIDLEEDRGKVIIPKLTSLRMATVVNNSKGEKSGILIININMDRFFNEFKRTVLYDLMIVDSKGRFILHSNSKYGIASDSFEKFLFEDSFMKEETVLALKNSEYFSKEFYSKKLENLNSKQDLRIVLSSKYKELALSKKRDKEIIYLIFILLVLFLLPLIEYFSRVPDRLKKRLKTQMITDNLTKLSNKEGLFYDYSKSNCKDKVVVIVKIDNLMKIANAYGYKVSTQLLKVIGKFLEEYEFRGGFLELYKLDRDSFAFVYNFENRYILKKDLQKLYKDVENEEYILGNDFKILVECSISSSSMNETNISKKVEEAEVALEMAQHIKSDIYIYDKKDKRADLNKENINLAAKIKKAIENENVIIHFQPIYNNRTAVIEKYETLVRLSCENELIYPDKFLTIAKDIRKYKKLTEIIVEKSFKFFQNIETEFSINLSIEDISSKQVRNFIYKNIEKYQVAKKLVIEIVESEAIENNEEFLEFIKSVKSLGCKVAIDDFGSGYSNYQYIINLNEYIDYLKIDGSLIKDIHLNRKTQLLVGTLKFLCDNLGIKTIAEYIENKDIFDYVKSMGINYSQGYYIGKPCEEIVELKAS